MRHTSFRALFRMLVAAALALEAVPALGSFPFPAAKDGVIFGANLRSPRGVLRFGPDVYFTDADLGICRAVPNQEPVVAPGDAVLTVDAATCTSVDVTGTPTTFPSSDPTTLTPYDVVLAPHGLSLGDSAPGIARLFHTATSGLQLIDSVAAPAELVPSAVAYDANSGYAYVGYSNSDRIDRFYADPLATGATVEPCMLTSDGSTTRSLAFVGFNLFVAQGGGTGPGSLAVAENLAGTGCPLQPEPIIAATTLGHPNFPAVSGVAGGPGEPGLSWWLFVAEPVGTEAVIHRLKIMDGSALPDSLFIPEVYSYAARFADLQTADNYRGDVALSYFAAGSSPGVLFVADDPGPAATVPAGRIWSMSDMRAPVIASPADGTHVISVSIIGTWPDDDPWRTFGTVALLFDEEGYIVASSAVPAAADGAFTLAYPDAIEGERRFVVRTADSADEPTFNISPPTAVLTLFVGASDADVTPPSPPTFAHPSAGAVLRDQRVTFSGAAEPEATVVLHVDGQFVASLQVAADGAWNGTSTFPSGQHVASAVARDAAGNASGEASVTFTIEPATAGGAGNTSSDGGGGCATSGSGAVVSLLIAAAAVARRARV